MLGIILENNYYDYKIKLKQTYLISGIKFNLNIYFFEYRIQYYYFKVEISTNYWLNGGKIFILNFLLSEYTNYF